MVDGYGWPVTGIFDLGWEKVTKFRLEPAFYSVEVNVLVNLDTWKGLTDAQRKVLNDAALWLEGLDSENAAVIAAERERQTKAGIQPIDFGAGGSKKFLEKANEVAWQSVIKRAPENGAEAAATGGELVLSFRGAAKRRTRNSQTCAPYLASGFRVRACGAPRNDRGQVMTRLSNAFGKLFDALAVVAALTLLAMVVLVTADIVLRNLTRTGFPWANEVTEYALYVITLLTAPWLLRRGQHVRIDLVLSRGAAARRVADGSGRRRARVPGLPRDGALRLPHGGRERPARLDHHQEPGVPGMVAAGAAAAVLCAARARIRVPASPR